MVGTLTTVLAGSGMKMARSLRGSDSIWERIIGSKTVRVLTMLGAAHGDIAITLMVKDVPYKGCVPSVVSDIISVPTGHFICELIKLWRITKRSAGHQVLVSCSLGAVTLIHQQVGAG